MPEVVRESDHTNEWRERVREKLKNSVAEIHELARKLRDDTYESQDEFREDLNRLCDMCSLVRNDL